MHPRRLEREDRAVLVPCPSRSPARGPTWGACRKPRARLPADPGGDVAALRCPPPAGPPVGLSCWSVLPASWSRLSPAALSAHSYLERPGPAGSAATMAPPRGNAELCAAQPRPPSRAPGLEGWQMRSWIREGGLFERSPSQIAHLGTQVPDIRATHIPGYCAERFRVHISRFSHSPNSEKSCFQGGNSGDSRWWKGSYGNRKRGRR